MYINLVGRVPSFGNKRIFDQAKKIIDKTMGTKTQLTVSQGSFYKGLKITIPHKEGAIIVNGTADSVTLVQDFAKVQKAIQAGIIKPRPITKIGL